MTSGYYLRLDTTWQGRIARAARSLGLRRVEMWATEQIKARFLREMQRAIKFTARPEYCRTSASASTSIDTERAQ